MLEIKVPICHGTYSTGCTKDVIERSFLKAVHQAFTEQKEDYLPFFLGVCYHCWAPRYIPGYSCALLRCSGCQLVAYCSRECQKYNWSKHKYVCKEFPVVKSKNVLYAQGSWKKHIASLRKQAAQVPYAKPIFHYPRVCRTCKEARQDKLTDCVCMSVSYCSQKCKKADKQHQNYCKDLLQITHIYSSRRSKWILPSIRIGTVCNKFTPLSSWKDLMPSHYNEVVQQMSYTDEKDTVHMEDSLIKERLSYPMSLLYALQTLPGRRISCSGSRLEDLTTLDIHVVTSIPLYDSEPWEILMHRLPKLMQLNIVYIKQGI